MSVFLLDNSLSFPHPSLACEDGLLAVGGDLSPKRLILAYSNGIFPWFEQGEEIFWWAPNPRYIVEIETYKPSKNLLKLIKNDKFTVKFNVDFERIIENCAKISRKDQVGTWIGNDMIKAYSKLHKLGFVMCIGVYYYNELVGGLYGVELKQVFCGESMYHTMSDAGNVAFYYLIEYCKQKDIKIIDAQMETENMRKYGGHYISFDEYQKYLFS
ncbi:MAG: leucyl/phenylalanyl-tRNA--protein transferase [Bacteroidales bacterium]|nr:leucyl/phenylalanyl-tRNA--protein transferase [Bacteroidales bacterium]